MRFILNLNFILIFICFFIFIDNANGQKNFQGTVVDSITNKGVPFATVSLVKANKGTNADENGEFSIMTTKISDDTLTVSCIGYETYKIACLRLSSNPLIKIRKRVLNLEEVVILGKLQEPKWLNDYSNCGSNWFTSSGTTAMIAKHFHSSTPKAILTELKFCKMRGKSLFRIRIFDMDTILFKPSSDLIDTIIEVTTIEKHVKIDLKKYKIIIPQKDFFVAIEWLCIPYNQSNMVIKNAGQRFIITKFLPELAVRYINSKLSIEDNFPQTWQYDYRGKWNPSGMNMEMVMAVKLEYQ